MTEPSDFDQKGQSVKEQINIRRAGKVIIQPPGSASALPVPQEIPPQPADFTGREDEIKGLLEKFGHGATITGLRGMGGVGKTALALVLADRLKNRFADGQLFLDMLGTSKSPLDPKDAMAHVIRSYLGADASLPEELNGLSGLYLTVLNGKKALILLDNAADRDQVEPLLPPNSCSLLVTSRNKFTLPGLAEKDLDVLPQDDAKNLLLEICERIGDHAEELAKLCGRLPIALRNAASILREKPNLSVANYIKRLGDARERLELVEASFTLSYDLLTPELQRLWSLLSIFPADFDLAGAAAVWEMEEMPAEDALGELIRWSLVEFSPSATGEGGRYRLHDLARDFAGSKLYDYSRETARLRHARYYLNILRKAEESIQEGNDFLAMGLMLFDIDWINIEAGQKWASENKFKCTEIAEICSDFAWMGNILNLRLHPSKYIEWLNEALTAVREINNKGAEGAHLGNLGLAYFHLGNPHKAIEYFEQALKISREIGDEQLAIYSLGNLGLAYSHLGDPNKAIEYTEQVLKISSDIEDWKAVANSLDNLGKYHSHLGDPHKAIEYYEQALKISRSIGDLVGEIAHLGNLGLAYFHVGDTQKAIEYYEQSIKISHKIGDLRGEGINLSNLGLAYFHLGDPHKAIEYYEQALKISRKIGDKENEGIHLGNVGEIYLFLGDPQKAIEFYDRALKISQEISYRRAEGAHLGKLGIAYFHLNNLQKAIKLYDQALEISREIGDRQGEGSHLGNLGLAYFDLGDPRKAIDFYEEALVISWEIGDRRGEGKGLFNMSLSLHALGQNEEALSLARSALAIFEEIESPSADAVCKKLAEWSD